MVIKKKNKLKNKKILITAGPTWVAIDRVRVISNIATGQTGIELAKALRQFGAQVTLLLGPTERCLLNQGIRLVRFKYFEELKARLKDELKAKKYDLVIHSAAVSDFRPQARYSGKISSERKSFSLKLIQSERLINLIKKLDQRVFLVGFKFEPGASKEPLITEAKKLIKKAGLDLVVANTIKNKRYQAYILNREKIIAQVKSKRKLAIRLINLINSLI